MAEFSELIDLAIRDEIAVGVPRILQDVREAMLKTAGIEPLSVRVKTAARLTDLSVRTIERMMEDGVLPWKKVKTVRLVSYEALKEMVKPENMTGTEGDAQH